MAISPTKAKVVARKTALVIGLFIFLGMLLMYYTKA